jgi:hypothetical protein
MTLPRSTSPLIAFTLALLGLVFAAHAQQSTSSGADKMEWPRTFSGQPDFAFTREEAITEARIRSARDNEPMPLIPTLQQLMNDDTNLDPLGLNRPVITSATEVSSTESDNGVSGTAAPARAMTLLEKLMANAVALPQVSGTLSTNVAEFRTNLFTTISNTVSNWNPTAGRYNFDAVISTLTLQAVVTSPVKYAVINQQKYVEGDTFQLQVPVDVPDLEITNALQAQMPVSGTLSPDIYAQYQQVYTEVYNAFSSARSRNVALGRQMVTVPVSIRAIEPRKVFLDVNGQTYELPIRFAY